MSTRSNLGAGQPPSSGLPGTVRPPPAQPVPGVPDAQAARGEAHDVDRTDRHGRNPGEPGFGTDDAGRAADETSPDDSRPNP